MKSKRSQACDITTIVRKVVMDRDCGCIVCGITRNLTIAHFIPRSAGGLGVEQNLVCMCLQHHEFMDHTIHRKQYLVFTENYLKGKYSNWDKEKLIYKKWG